MDEYFNHAIPTAVSPVACGIRVPAGMRYFDRRGEATEVTITTLGSIWQKTSFRPMARMKEARRCKGNRSNAIKLGSRFAARWRPPFSANHHSLEPETPVGRKALTLRIVKLECTLFDVDDRRITFGPDRERPE